MNGCLSGTNELSKDSKHKKNDDFVWERRVESGGGVAWSDKATIKFRPVRRLKESQRGISPSECLRGQATAGLFDVLEPMVDRIGWKSTERPTTTVMQWTRR